MGLCIVILVLDAGCVAGGLDCMYICCSMSEAKVDLEEWLNGILAG